MADIYVGIPKRPYVSLIGENTKITGVGENDVQPQILVSFVDGAKYGKDVKMTFGGRQAFYSLEEGDSVFSHQLTFGEANALLQQSGANFVNVGFEITYSKEGISLEEKQSFNFQIAVSDEYLNSKVEEMEIKIEYEKVYSRPLDQEIEIGELLDRDINSFFLIINNIPSNITEITAEFNRRLIRFSGPFTNMRKKFGPYKEFNMSIDPGENLKLTIKDDRGLQINKEVKIEYRRYFDPVISISDIQRQGGFGTNIVVRDLKVQYFKLKDNLQRRNRLTSFNLNYYSNNDTGFTPKVIDPDLLTEEAPPTDYTIGGNKKFLENESYRIQFTASDIINPVSSGTGKSKLFSVTTGRPIMYMDSARAEVGIGTTDPLGSFHVEGTSYARASFALNSIFYKPGIPEDNEAYEPPWVMSSPGVIDDVFQGSVDWGKLNELLWLDLRNKTWGELKKD